MAIVLCGMVANVGREMIQCGAAICPNLNYQHIGPLSTKKSQYQDYTRKVESYYYNYGRMDSIELYRCRIKWKDNFICVARFNNVYAI